MNFQEKYNNEYWLKKTNLELKHLVLSSGFINFFNLPIDAEAFDYGCGSGSYVDALRKLHVNAFGYDPSKYAISNATGLSKDYISSTKPNFDENHYYSEYNLVLCIDVMEHLELNEIKRVLDDVKCLAKKNAVFSICFEDNPDFNKDVTHVTKRSKEWWVDVLTIHGFKVSDAPKDWIFNDQFLVCEMV